MIPATIAFPDVFSKIIFWNYFDQIGWGEPVEVYAWPRFTWQFTGDNLGHCSLEIYGTHEGLQGLCWGLLYTLPDSGHMNDRLSDSFMDGHKGPITRTVRPYLRGNNHPDNRNGVFLFCTKLFAPI